MDRKDDELLKRFEKLKGRKPMSHKTNAPPEKVEALPPPNFDFLKEDDFTLEEEEVDEILAMAEDINQSRGGAIHNLGLGNDHIRWEPGQTVRSSLKEYDDPHVANLLSQTKDAVLLNTQDEEEDSDLSQRLMRLKKNAPSYVSPPATAKIGNALGPPPSLPFANPEDKIATWCSVCIEDAAIRCHGCDDDLYCEECFLEGHRGPGAGYQEKRHKWDKYVNPLEKGGRRKSS
ncbi:hypothetical protein YB2330_004647 [Saitoella coloradoensis]